MNEPRWDLFPRVASNSRAHAWLQYHAELGRAANTLSAYGYSLELFLSWCEERSVRAEEAKKGEIVGFLGHLMRGRKVINIETRAAASNATLQVRLSALRGWFDFLVEEGVRETNPVGRGSYSPKNRRRPEAVLIPRRVRFPWIPTGEEWLAVLEAAREESLRNRLMVALAYCGALRRSELCHMDIDHLDVGRRQVAIPPLKSKRERLVMYSSDVDPLLQAYLRVRRCQNRALGPMFLSTSNRNNGSRLGEASWTKIVEGIAERAGLPRFTTHTLRHLRLTDLARQGWQLHEITLFAGHEDPRSTLIYIHLSGRELSAKVAKTMQSMDARLQRLYGKSVHGPT